MIVNGLRLFLSYYNNQESKLTSATAVFTIRLKVGNKRLAGVEERLYNSKYQNQAYNVLNSLF